MKPYFKEFETLYPEKKQYINWIQMCLENISYNYGDHLKYPAKNVQLKYLLKSRISHIKHYIINTLENKQLKYHNAVLSNAPSSLNSSLSHNGIKVLSFPWSNCIGEFSNNEYSSIIKDLLGKDLDDYLSDSFYKRVYHLYEGIKAFLLKNSIKAIICNNDMYPLERMSIDACKEIGIPSFVFLHGLPGRYNDIDDNRADYLCVWGDRIRDLYIKAGVDSDKILVTGHPVFSNFGFGAVGNYNLSNPLVISYVGCGIPSDSKHHFIGDRGNTLIYPWVIECALKKMGVQKARLRLHPSENPTWYKKNIDNLFYTIDKDGLDESLSKSSIIIGPTSTVSLDAAIKGVPYFAYTLKLKNTYPLVAPFDNSEKDFPIADTIEDLCKNIHDGRYMKPSAFANYIKSSFNLSLILNNI